MPRFHLCLLALAALSLTACHDSESDHHNKQCITSQERQEAACDQAAFYHAPSCDLPTCPIAPELPKLQQPNCGDFFNPCKP